MVPEAPRSTETWIDRLFETDLFAEQRKQAARTALPEERIRAMLLRSTPAAASSRVPRWLRVSVSRCFGSAASCPPFRRVLNVDGYAVMSVAETSETIELNRDLLATQFGLASDNE